MTATPSPSGALRRTPHHLSLVSPGEPSHHRTVAELIALARDEERQGRRGAARLAFERALYLVRTPEEAAQTPDLLRWIARTYQGEADAEAALDALEAAIASAEAWGDEAAAGHAVNVQAAVRWQQGNLDEAERLYLVARARAMRVGDAKLAAMTAQNLGVLANLRGDYGEAHGHYQASLAEYRSLGLTTEVSYALNNIGLLHTAQRHWGEAERAFSEAVQISELAGDVSTRTVLDVNLAEMWVARGEHARAQACVRHALDAAARTGDGSAIGKATKLLGVIAREAGDLEDAERHFLRADEIATARNELLLQGEIARERADLARRLGKNRDVLQQLNRAHRLFTQLRARPDLADVADRLDGLEQQFLHVARRWGESIEAKDRYTQGHCVRVAELACAVAERAGFDEHALFWFRIGALLHDVGKLVIPAEVLNKPGKLTDEEWALMRSHTTAGVEMLTDVEFPWDVRPIIESHHERWDGKGYPHGLAGENIPLVARILCVADVYDALTSVRSYKRALTHDEAMAILRGDVGTMFDPAVFAWFEQVAEAWPSHVAHIAAEPAADPAPSAEPAAPAAPSDHDDLTHMPLRRAFRETAERILTARRTTERPVSLLVVDIDHFKLVNDTFGHLQGDDVLRMVAEQLRVMTRPSDYLARYAGDEFVVLLPGSPMEDACGVAERIRDAVARSACPRRGGSGETVAVTLSIGVATAPTHGDSIEALFSAADAALYGAKRAGRDAVTPAGAQGAGRQEMLLDCFVGREAERHRLRRLLDGASQGDPHVVAVLGEAGIGKSSLLRQLAPDVGVRSGSLLVGRCIEADVRPPYGPWADIVLGAHRAGVVPRRGWRELPRLVPELPAEPGSERSGEGSQYALLEELEQFLTLASASRPLLVLLDDMQWADPATWEALEYLTARLTHQRILFSLTIRAEDLSGGGEERRRRLSRSERYSELALARLGRDELGQWLRTALGGQVPDAALLDRVMEQSEGNALFAAQTLRALIDDGRLRHLGDRWHFDAGGQAQLPRAIGDLLARRLGRLSRECRDVLAVAAVLGREFDPETLVTACDRSEDAVLEALDAGMEAAVLEPSERAHGAVAFTHALLTNVLQQQVNPLRLRRIHERVARALETTGRHAPAEVAVHFDRAGCAADAYRTAVDAGARAASVYAYETAVEFFEIARRHAQGLREMADVEWRLAQIEELRGQYAHAEAHCDALLSSVAAGAAALGVLPAARRMHERIRLQRGVPVQHVLDGCLALLAEARRRGDTDEVVPLLIMVSAAHARLGDVAAAESAAREAAQEADRSERPALQADAAMRLGSTVIEASPADAVPHYRRALDIFTRLDDRYGQLRCQINVGSACDRAGNHPAAEVSYATALSIGREIRASDLTGVASLNLGVLLLKTGRFAAAHERFTEALHLFTTIGNEPYRLGALYNLAHLARAQRDAAGALELYGATAALATSLGHTDVLAGALAGAGLADLDLGEVRVAAEQQTAVGALVAPRAGRWFQGCELCDALGVRLVAASSPAEALALLRPALARADQHDPHAALWLAAECAAVLADGDGTAAIIQRYLVQARALGYAPLVLRLQQATRAA